MSDLLKKTSISLICLFLVSDLSEWANERWANEQMSKWANEQIPSPGYDTAQSQSPRGIIPGKSYDFSRSYWKGQSNKIFDMFLS